MVSHLTRPTLARRDALCPKQGPGSMATEAYPLGYVAGTHATEKEVGCRFQHPSHCQHDLTEKLST